MPAKFSFFEVVIVESERPALSEISGMSGAILGMAENDNGVWIYAVHILDTDESWDVSESELIATGNFMKKDDFYEGDS